jgi:hypothetical protein
MKEEYEAGKQMCLPCKKSAVRTRCNAFLVDSFLDLVVAAATHLSWPNQATFLSQVCSRAFTLSFFLFYANDIFLPSFAGCRSMSDNKIEWSTKLGRGCKYHNNPLEQGLWDYCDLDCSSEKAMLHHDTLSRVNTQIGQQLLLVQSLHR